MRIALKSRWVSKVSCSWHVDCFVVVTVLVSSSYELIIILFAQWVSQRSVQCFSGWPWLEFTHTRVRLCWRCRSILYVWTELCVESFRTQKQHYWWRIGSICIEALSLSLYELIIDNSAWLISVQWYRTYSQFELIPKRYKRERKSYISFTDKDQKLRLCLWSLDLFKYRIQGPVKFISSWKTRLTIIIYKL